MQRQGVGRANQHESTRIDGRGLESRGPREEIFLYWVEVRDLQSGSTRSLPLGGVTRIHIPSRKKETPRPREEIFQLKDDSGFIETKRT
jgi:hypothetical protein